MQICSPMNLFRNGRVTKAMLLFSSLALSSTLFGQSDTSSQLIDDVIIQSERIQIPFNKQNRDIVILDAKTIQTLPVQSLDEILGYISGLDIRQRGPWGGQADVSVNGGTFDQTLILLNGVKVIDPQTGHNMMNLPISPDAIDRIEIMRGSAASAYGINAISGVINIVTKKPNASNVWVNVGYGSSFESDTSNSMLYSGTNIGVSASFNHKKVNQFLSLYSQNSSGYRYNTAMSNQKLFYQNEFGLGGESKIQMMGGFVYNDFGANAFYAAPGDIESKETVQTGIAAVKGEFKLSPHWKMRPMLSYRYGFDDYLYTRKNPSLYRNQHFTHVVEGAIHNTLKNRVGVFGIGTEYRLETINSNSLGKRKRDNVGVFVNYNFSKIEKLTVNVGAYLNYSDFFGLKLLPSLDAGYQLNSQWRIFANIGTGTRLPTYTDWYYRGPQNIGNSNLMPENAVHSELGVRYNNKRNFQSSVIGFYHETNDFIDWVKDSIAAPWQPENFQTIRMPGVTVNADYILFVNATKNTDKIQFGLSYTRLEPTIVILQGNENLISRYALENLTDQLVIRMQYKMKEKYSVMVAGRYEQRVRTKDYVLLDAKFDASFGKVKAYLSLNNLLNVTYIEAGAVPLPGRWAVVGVQWQLNR